MDPTIITQGGVAAVIVYILLKYQAGRDKSQERRDKEFVAAIKDLSKNSKKQTEAMNTVARAQVKTASEAAQRNGHLGEQNIQITEMIAKSNKDTINAINNLPAQHVDFQKVDKQTIVKKEGI